MSLTHGAHWAPGASASARPSLCEEPAWRLNVYRSFLMIDSMSCAAPATLSIGEMVDDAATIGANAVVGVDLDYETVGQNGTMLMVTTAGTAVTVE